MIRGHKQKNTAFFANLKRQTDGRNKKAVPVIIINDKGQIALIIQDNAPVWRVFGNEFFDEPPRKYDRKGMYYHHAKRILKRETNLPHKLLDKIKPILRYDAITPATKVRFESNRVFVLNIGDFPLESRKGAFVAFFDMNARPKNMNSNHGPLFDLVVKQIKNGHNRELFTALMGASLHLAALDHLIKTGDIITGEKQWKSHPKVIEKGEKGLLDFDPQTRMITRMY